MDGITSSELTRLVRALPVPTNPAVETRFRMAVDAVAAAATRRGVSPAWWARFVADLDARSRWIATVEDAETMVVLAMWTADRAEPEQPRPQDRRSAPVEGAHSGREDGASRALLRRQPSAPKRKTAAPVS